MRPSFAAAAVSHYSKQVWRFPKTFWGPRDRQYPSVEFCELPFYQEGLSVSWSLRDPNMVQTPEWKFLYLLQRRFRSDSKHARDNLAQDPGPHISPDSQRLINSFTTDFRDSKNDRHYLSILYPNLYHLSLLTVYVHTSTLFWLFLPYIISCCIKNAWCGRQHWL